MYTKAPGNADTFTYSSVQIDAKIAGGGGGTTQSLDEINTLTPLKHDLNLSSSAYNLLIPARSTLIPARAIRYDETQTLIANAPFLANTMSLADINNLNAL